MVRFREEPEGSLYTALGVSRSASAADVRHAFRSAARACHPDKGGEAGAFAALRAAYQVLSDPAQRAAYDDLGGDLNYVPGVSHRARGGESALLDELERLGLVCEPSSQLVCMCELCGRPATKECYVCTTRFCEFCTRTQHWKGAFGLHFPVHNTPHLAEKLGRRQLEAKRVEDGERAARAVPHFRSDGELKELRAFKEAAAGCLPHAGAGAAQAMQRYYCWAQTAELVLLAVHVPTGYEDRQLRWEVTAQLLVVQAEDSAAVIERTLSHPLAPGAQVDAFVSQDNRLLTLVMRKAAPSHWRSLFRGDSAGDRCIQPPYELLEADHDVVMEWRLPAWVQAAHLRVDVTQEGLTVDVDARRGAERRASGGGSGGDDAAFAFALQRTFWKDPDSGVRRTSEPVSPEQCSWSLCDAAGEARGPAGLQEPAMNDKLLTVLFVKPPLTDDERQFMKGRRADNRAANAGGPVAQRGARFFVDDADDFGLEDILQALCFFLTGTAYVAPKPHQAYGQPAARAFWASSEAQLSQAARQQLQLLMAAKGEEQEATQMAPSRTRA